MMRDCGSGEPFFSAPLARAIMRLAVSCATKKAPRVLVSKTKSKSSGVTSTMRCVVETPELLTRISMVPASVSAWAMAARMLSGSVTSRRTTWALPPFDSISARSSFKRSTRREASTTLAPAAASVCAKRAPRPLDAPVISATLPSRLIDKPMMLRPSMLV